ncbi:zinc transporter ZIP11-like [Leptonychotes weddellii]|uniref:Zinc transporter ZIP11 n=1 Tax=Leptonychotes weddellii TaxID=9713 RepID=A0A7F8QC86_LEPWE|nr:zinc transporter ZIP11-like [Leptonychotes weddellii]
MKVLNNGASNDPIVGSLSSSLTSSQSPAPLSPAGAEEGGSRNLAIGIGIQNFPEGLAVSLPLRGAGFSPWRAFWYGQLSGMVEPLAGVLGAFAVVLAEPLLPYALAFAAGAMVYVVMDDIIPEAQISLRHWAQWQLLKVTTYRSKLPREKLPKHFCLVTQSRMARTSLICPS